MHVCNSSCCNARFLHRTFISHTRIHAHKCVHTLPQQTSLLYWTGIYSGLKNLLRNMHSRRVRRHVNAYHCSQHESSLSHTKEYVIRLFNKEEITKCFKHFISGRLKTHLLLSLSMACALCARQQYAAQATHCQHRKTSDEPKRFFGSYILFVRDSLQLPAISL